MAPVDEKLLSHCLTARYCDFESVLEYISDVWEMSFQEQIDTEIAKIEAGLI